MEDKIRLWYRTVLRKDGFRLTPTKDNLTDKDTENSSEITWQQWKDICGQLELDPGDRDKGGMVRLAADIRSTSTSRPCKSHYQPSGGQDQLHTGTMCEI